MKQSHLTTPRQMRDASWTSGSVSADSSPPWNLRELAFIAIVAGLGILGFVVSSGG